MSSNMTAPYKTLFNFGNTTVNYSYMYFAKMITRKPKNDNLTNITKLYPLLESKQWHLLLKRTLWWCDITWKPRIGRLFTACKCIQYKKSFEPCHWEKQIWLKPEDCQTPDLWDRPAAPHMKALRKNILVETILLLKRVPSLALRNHFNSSFKTG